MKKFFFAIIIATITSIATYAQIDVKTLNGMSDEQIRKVFGEPIEYGQAGEDDDFLYYYSNTFIALTRGTRILSDFYTTSPDYCILTKYIPGGIKVGDPFTKLQKVDFSKVDYGRNDPENALSPDSDPTFNYVIFKNEYHQVSFMVEGGIIKKWFFTSDRDANPNKTYINFWE